jgi:hypothetical protein
MITAVILVGGRFGGAGMRGRSELDTITTCLLYSTSDRE